MALLATTALAQPAATETAAWPEVASISASLQPFVDRGDLPGAVALVAVDGRVIHCAGVGLADVASERPMQPDTLFSIMSMTKPITAVALLTLCQEGRVQLDSPVGSYLPEFASGSGSTITVRQLLTHTSGLFSDQRNTGSLAETAASLAKGKLMFAPGSQWMYGPGLSVAGRVVEAVSGVPFAEYVTTRICEPLAMHDTTYYPTAEQLARLATVYSYDPKAKELRQATINFLGPLESRSPNPSGGLYSTARDQFRFYQMLLGGGELEGKRVLSAEMVAEMTRPQTGELKAGFVPGSVWGLGVGLVREPQGVTEPLSVGTFGHGGMFGTQAWADPAQRVIYILLIQRLGLPNGDASEYRDAFQRASAEAVKQRAAGG